MRATRCVHLRPAPVSVAWGTQGAGASASARRGNTARTVSTRVTVRTAPPATASRDVVAVHRDGTGDSATNRVLRDFTVLTVTSSVTVLVEGSVIRPRGSASANPATAANAARKYVRLGTLVCTVARRVSVVRVEGQPAMLQQEPVHAQPENKE